MKEKEAQKRALEAWERPLAQPKAVPKPSGKKKKKPEKEEE